MFRSFILLSSTLCLLLGLVACSDDPSAPGIEPEIRNTAASFEFQVSAVRNYTGTLEYVWSNSEISANLDRSPSLTAGTVRLTILDSAGATVHDADLVDGSLATTEGQAGDWTLRVRFAAASGDLNFRLQPRTP